MANPIIIDDGGSTRIRYLPEEGSDAMDGLLNPLSAGVSAHSHHVPGEYRTMRIAWILVDGSASHTPAFPLQQDDVIEIDCGNGQMVRVRIDSKLDCHIKLRGHGENSPMVEAKQYDGKRRYVFVNAIKIARVDLTRAGATSTVHTSPLGSVHSSLVFHED